jgi:type IX secretion system PorP/SprF family membrane protein
MKRIDMYKMASHLSLKSLLMWLLLVMSNAFAQDPTFSQYFNNKQYLNPAYAGSENGIRAGMVYRNQWPSLPGQFNTFAFSGDMGIRAVQGGVGMLLLSDQTGKNTFNTKAAYLNFQKLVRIMSNTSRLCVAYFAVQSGFVQKKYDWNNLVFTDQLDPVLGVVQNSSAVRPENVQKNYADLGAGSVLRYKTSEHYSAFGFAVTHLNRPSQSFYGSDSKLPIKWTIHYVAQIPIHKMGIDNEIHTFLSPMFMFEKQGYSEQINIGAKLHRDMFYAGLGYRFKRLNLVGQKVDAAVIHCGISGAYDNSYHWQLGYSYDATISGIRAGTAGTHEISLIFEYDKLKLGKHGLYTKTKHCVDHDSHVKNMPVF